ncbi:PAS domain S-box protein [Marinobacterium jannaschii]|uniref:PAS domain S-box protein n=1 Tax=Marinobacterium jannaschii TaxID=64970 RepID=UPI0006884CBF|nr:PAS domain S-box protein [Marinobacterium jannaschii]
MKINMPVTDQEVRLQEGQELVTKTDLKGVITYANPAFVEVSGFSEDELVGSNHNLVRHPDMPQAAFKDLWDTLQMGRPWTKLVKNRTKDGNYYWVKANVTPIYQNGQPIEYMSVRTSPSREEIAESERLYAQLNNNQATIPSPNSIAASDLSSGLFKVAMVAVVVMVVLSGALFFSGMDKSLIALGPLAAFFVMLFGAMSHQQKKVVEPLKAIVEEIRTVGEGRYLHPIDVVQPGELGELRRAIKSLAVRMGFEVNDAKEQGNRSLRIKQALDNVNSNVMVADTEGYIIYMNEAVLDMMRKAESDIRKDLPEFDTRKLLGANFDSFHKDPSHQRRMISALKETFNGRIVVGGAHLQSGRESGSRRAGRASGHRGRMGRYDRSAGRRARDRTANQ